MKENNGAKLLLSVAEAATNRNRRLVFFSQVPRTKTSKSRCEDGTYMFKYQVTQLLTASLPISKKTIPARGSGSWLKLGLRLRNPKLIELTVVQKSSTNDWAHWLAKPTSTLLEKLTFDNFLSVGNAVVIQPTFSGTLLCHTAHLRLTGNRLDPQRAANLQLNCQHGYSMTLPFRTSFTWATGAVLYDLRNNSLKRFSEEDCWHKTQYNSAGSATKWSQFQLVYPIVYV